MARPSSDTIALVALVALLALPRAALGASPQTVSGTVTRDGLPVAGVEVAVTVTGSDQIASTTTDATGAFSLQVDAVTGSVISVSATGATVSTSPDPEGCIVSETPIGRMTVTVTPLPIEPLAVVLDQVIGGRVCTATGTPGPVATPRVEVVTPPATDGSGPSGRTGSGSGWEIAVAALALVAAGSLAIARRRA
jgi:hypothetical protein